MLLEKNIMIKRIILTEFTNEAATRIAGIELKKILEDLLLMDDEIIVDFSNINKFAAPFFNNSFAALVISKGYEEIIKIKLDHISEVEKMVYDTSLSNAELLLENPDYSDIISKIGSTTSKKIENKK